MQTVQTESSTNCCARTDEQRETKTPINNLNFNLNIQLSFVNALQFSFIMQSSRPASRPKPLNWSSPSNATVFIRNLKLLQLDQLEDWPDINAHALSPTPQNQRQRVKAVEWALYQLFAIWDPEGTRDKLRPFFPPLEPLQSVNLRAALFRALSELKKNGDLGREAILRKTMLDDCKGDRFDEILAGFSNIVVRKVLTATREWAANPAIRMATARGVAPEEYQTIMVPLILAHQASLGAMGERHARMRTTYDKFSQLLDRKKTELANRTKENYPSVLGEPAKFDHISREVKTNWLGSEEWANALLYGGSRSSTDGFLELPFSKAWSRANESTVEELSNAPIQDLVMDLESRVSHQRNRMRRWHEFSNSIRKTDDSARPNQAINDKNGSPLVFRDHQPLTVASISKTVRNSTSRSEMKGEDQDLLSSLKEAFAQIDGKPLSFNDNGPAQPGPEEEAETVGNQDSLPQPAELDRQRPASPAGASRDDARIYRTTKEYKREKQEPFVVNITSEDAEPKPEPNADNIDSDFDTPKPAPRPHAHTLVERTRKSMSLVPPPSNYMQENHLSPRKSRQSFPVNQFETPRKQSPRRSGAVTPQDDLLDEKDDYASVFKSRPRIAQSPISSPAVHVSPLDEFDLNDDEVRSGSGTPFSPANIEFDGQRLENSPLYSRRRIWK